MKKIFTLLSLYWVSNAIFGQDSTQRSLAAFLRQGSVSGQSRVYFMNTNNQAPLSDYYGLGIGAGIGYQTPEYKGFSAGLSGYFIINAYSSDFTQVDSITQNPNRYELGLFDVTDPSNKSNLYRLEDLFLKYRKNGLTLTYGQFKPNYLFINPQDGRMSPTMVRGFDGVYKKGNSKIQLAFLDHISPRSTVKWYRMEDSFGIYPMGRDTDGKASDYLGKVKSKGVFMGEGNQKVGSVLQAKFGYLNVSEVFNTGYLQLDLKKKSLNFSLLGIVQSSSKNNENEAYLSKDFKSKIFSGRIEQKIRNSKINLNYSRIGKQGRFLMPREWGREPLFTFLPRERNEGLADVQAFSINYQHTFSKQFTGHLGLGKYKLPEATEAFKNKYAIPSYSQLNIDFNYNFEDWLEGGSLKFLYVYKKNDDLESINPKLIFNKVNVGLINLIFNYGF